MQKKNEALLPLSLRPVKHFTLHLLHIKISEIARENQVTLVMIGKELLWSCRVRFSVKGKAT